MRFIEEPCLVTPLQLLMPFAFFSSTFMSIFPEDPFYSEVVSETCKLFYESISVPPVCVRSPPLEHRLFFYILNIITEFEIVAVCRKVCMLKVLNLVDFLF